MFKRIKQFYKGITAKITEEDRIFIRKHLDKKTKELFLSLPISEQRHSIDVAKTAIGLSKGLGQIELDILIKASLLHDIGKINTGLNPFTKSIAVLFDKISPKLAQNTKIKFIKGYYHHPQMGAELLKNLTDEEVIYLVKNHQSKQKGTKLLELLKKADSLN